MSEDMSEIRNRRDLIRAKNMAQWGIIGVVFPIIGILIAIVARQRVNYVIETKKNYQEIDEVRRTANIWILVSLAAAVLWWCLFYSLKYGQESM